MLRYLLGISDEERQQLRDEVLSTTPEDFHAFGQAIEAAFSDSAVVVLGSADSIKESRLNQAGELVITKVL